MARSCRASLRTRMGMIVAASVVVSSMMSMLGTSWYDHYSTAPLLQPGGSFPGSDISYNFQIMGILVEERLSDSPFVERIWRAQSDSINTFISIAVSQWDFVVWRQQGKTSVVIQGPETKARQAPVPDNAEFFGILFRPGVFIPGLSSGRLVDSSLTLPEAAGKSFWLKASPWQLPTYENADTFVARLAREGVLVRESIVASVLQRQPADMSLRSIQRRFVQATGLSYRTMRQIERARRAALLLRQGRAIGDTTYEFGYSDQAHLTKSLKYFIGQTPAQLRDRSRPAQLSLLYKTDSFG